LCALVDSLQCASARSSRDDIDDDAQPAPDPDPDPTAAGRVMRANALTARPRPKVRDAQARPLPPPLARPDGGGVHFRGRGIREPECLLYKIRSL